MGYDWAFLVFPRAHRTAVRLPIGCSLTNKLPQRRTISASPLSQLLMPTSGVKIKQKFAIRIDLIVSSGLKHALNTWETLGHLERTRTLN